MNLLHTSHIPAGDGPFPTILTLHGWGASAHDLLGLAPLLHGGDALVLCPQGPVEVPIAPGFNGYGWFPITEGEPPDPMAFEEGKQALAKFVDDAIARYPIDPRKLVVVGFSQGGVMGYDLVLREPGRFAGLAALSSWLPEPLAQAIPVEDAHSGFPVLVQHGTEDPIIAVDRARESRDALQRFSVDLTYREHEMEHTISQEALRDLILWLQDKVIQPIVLV